ncbi:MAG: S41 family peptidase [Spirochaetaceae bacterium]
MKKVIIMIQLIIQLTVLYSQNINNKKPDFLWPIKDSYTGENTILSPLDQVFNSVRNIYQPNFNYHIGGDERAAVLAVADGIIYDYDYHYSDKPAYSYGSDDYEDIKQYVLKKDGNLKWISFSIGLKISNNEMVWYTGLHIDDKINLKTGDNVKQGDIIGTIGFDYPLLDQPSIHISYDKNGRLADLQEKMTRIQNPFFLKKGESENYKYKRHSTEDLINNLDIVIDSLEEIHPAIDNFTTTVKLREIYENIKKEIKDPLTSDQFYKRLVPLIQEIKDNHTYLSRKYYYDDFYNYTTKGYFPLEVTIINNKCYILDDPVHSIERGTEIIEINNEPVQNIIDNVKKIMTIASGDINAWQDELLKQQFGNNYILYKELNPGEVIKVKFNNNRTEEYILDNKVIKLNSHDDKNYKPYSLEMMSNDIVLFNVKSMTLSSVDKEEILSFYMNTKLKGKTIILDLRNNMGGEIENTYFLYSLFASKQFYPEVEKKVNSNKAYESFNYSLNLSINDHLYSDYIELDGKQGFYQNIETHPDNFKFIIPSNHRFKGNVYILTNGLTGSAAVKLSSYFKYFNRGKIVGQEGCGNFYTMNGLDFARIRLGETGIELNIPLIATRSGFIKQEDIPFNRGVIPDYYIVDSIEDVLSGNDEILNFTLKLIKDNNRKKVITSIIILLSLMLLISIILIRKFK